MASKKGLLKTCDRCGEQIFLKLKGTNYYDGGYTRTDDFEPEPEGWDWTIVKGKYRTLCPKCSREWERIGAQFLGEPMEVDENGK